MAKQGPTIGVVKPGGGMNMWERSLLPSGKLSRHGRLVKGTRASYHAAKRIARRAVHHARQEADKESTRILTQSLQNYTALQTSLEKRMPTL